MTWQIWVVVICSCISIICKLGVAYLEQDTESRKAAEVPMNRQQRRHPNGMVPSQKFQRVNVPKQKQGNNMAIKNW